MVRSLGQASAAAITGTTITGSSLVGPLTGSVTGNTAGTHTGAVVGNVTGDVTGNVTASSGTSTFNNVTVNGTLNMDATTAATITNLTNPTNAQDAATKAYVDTSVANLIDSAPGALDTLNELAAALGDDAAFSTTITNSIATKLPLAGGTMSGAIAMGTSKITGLGDPTTNQDAATKKYSDDQDALKLSLTGGTMSGAIAMGNNKITGLGTPTASTDATTKTYVDAILGSATAAATSAANAATSESNAATSETNAGNSASAALASQNAAAASYDLFDDRFLGAKSSAPTLDNDGNALVTGTLYFNSTSNIMYVYSGAGWQAAGSSVNGTSDRQTYTASAGQTVFAATYDTGYIDVYLNGVKLVAGTDFTATNGTSITLASGATINDVIDIVAYGTFVLADHYDSTASDARYVNVTGDTMTGSLTVPTVDINGGTIDGTVIGGATAAAITGTTGQFGTSLNVDGTVTADGLTFDVADFVNVTAKESLAFTIDSDNNQVSRNFTIFNDGTSQILFRADDTGDISFYEDTGTTAKFFWDASAESLGIGASPIANLSVLGGTSNASNLATAYSLAAFNITPKSTSGYSLQFGSGPSDFPYIQMSAGGAASGNLLIQPYGGNVGIGTAPSVTLHVKSPNPVFGLETTGTVSAGGTVYSELKDSTGTVFTSGFAGLANCYQFSTTAAAGFMRFLTGAQAEALRIDASGDVGIGMTPTNFGNGYTVLQVANASNGGMLYLTNTANAGGRIYGNGAGLTYDAFSTTYHAFNTNSAERLRIDSSLAGLVLNQTAQFPSSRRNEWD
jgi:hypothetical protein